VKKKKDIRAVYLAQSNVLSSVLSTRNNQTISVMLIARTKRNHFAKLLILFILFPLNSRHEKNTSVYKGLRGAFY
jgi:hypothetical protein